jgi:hypothetical protein
MSSCFAPGSVYARSVVDTLALGQVFSELILIFLSISFHRGSPYSYIICGMNNRPVGGRSSETVLPRLHE